MKKTRSVICMIIFFIIVLSMPVFANSGKINSIDYNILITENADIEVTEVWDVNFNSNTESIVKKVPGVKAITDVSIKEYNKDGSVKNEYEKIDINSVTANKFYVKDNDIYIGIDKSTNGEKKFISIEYKILNHINVYLDCAEFDLILQDKNFDFKSNEITGKVSFEKNIESLAGFNTWVHASTVSSVTKVEELSQINFFVDSNDSKDELDIKVAFPVDMLSIDSSKIIKGNRLKLIYEEEIVKNEEKTAIGERMQLVNGLIIAVAVLSILLAVILIIVLIVKIRKNKKVNKKEDNKEVESVEEKNTEKVVVKNQEVETLDKEKEEKK